jgi:gamma-glutamyl-gamma-aminobutyraldehyde dehydrogenase/4-guanidinobutyraldehyde dehydrogenase/NAD-dependent aldehyde dehydrogenase
MKTLEQWQEQAQGLSFYKQAFINGQFCEAIDKQTFDSISPRDGQRLCQIAACGTKDVDIAVQAARDSFNSGVWRELSAKQRKQTLLKLAQLMEQNTQELALLDSLDMGMTISDSYLGNVPGAIECIQWYAELADKLYDEVAPTSKDAVARIYRVPVGVVAAVTPWNYPLLIACWKIAPALAVGNSVVLKPAEQASLSALKLAQLAKEAGIPDGVFNVVPGLGDVVGKALGLHNDIDALAFTGSSAVGGLYMQYAGQSNLKRVSLECGGKTPNIVLADCQNLDAAAAAVVQGAFANQGQICNAGSRLIVDETVKAPLMEKVIELAKGYRALDPLDPAAKIGCLASIAHSQKVQHYVNLGLEQGANPLLSIESDTEDQKGNCYFSPQIFDQVSGEMAISHEEIFGPVLSVLTVSGVDQAIDVANSTPYALGAAIWSASYQTFEYAANAVQAGVVWHNCHDHGDISSPVGGFKRSGFGRDKSIHAFDKYLEYKTYWVNLK